MARGGLPGPGPREGGPEGHRGENRNEAGRGDADLAKKAEQDGFIEEFLSASAPDVLERFRELRTRDPEEAARKFRQMFPRMRMLYEMRSRDPEMFALRLRDIRHGRESLEAARAVARLDAKGAGTEDKARKEQVERLRRALGELYNVRGEILTKEIARIRTQLDEAARNVDSRAQMREETVEKFSQSMITRERERLEKRDAERDRRPGERGGGERGSGERGPGEREP